MNFFPRPLPVFARYLPLIGLAIAGLSGCIQNANSKNPVSVAAPARKDPKLEALISDYRRFFVETMAAAQLPGAAVVIVKGDSILYEEGFGVRKAGGGDSIDLNTVFRVGSLSKGFASILTGILVQQGWLDWRQRVQECYPQFTLKDASQAQRIQLWHLLSHTTGLPYHAFTNLIEKGYDIPKIVSEFFPKATLGGEEGKFYAYQNAAYCVIQEVMKAATGKSYPELLAENIFQPAGMAHASCDFNTIQRCSDKALPHFWTGNSFRSDTISPLYYNAAAAGGVNASISDMGEWLKLLLGHKPAIVADSTLDRVFKPIIDTGKERRILPHWIARNEAWYALGWRVLKHEGDTIMYHSGYVNGFRGEIAFNRRDDVGICVLMNANTELSSECVPAFFERWKAMK